MSFILFLFTSIYFGYYQYIIIIFFSVLIHELGHIFVALALKLKILEVQLYPFGGIAIMENLAKYGGVKELLVAIAGPIVSMLISRIVLIYGNSFAYSNIIYKYNKALFLFNLLPALPLDGGRIARNILLYRTGYKRATRLMTLNGKVLANILVLINLLYIIKGRQGIAYIVSAIFIYIGAVKEEKNCSYIFLLNRNNKKERMITRNNFSYRPLKVFKETYLRNIVDQFSPGNICKIQVYDDGGNFILELREADIMDGFLKHGYFGKIKDIL